MHSQLFLKQLSNRPRGLQLQFFPPLQQGQNVWNGSDELYLHSQQDARNHPLTIRSLML